MTKELEDEEARIGEYLSLGGLFNPELADHDAVRDLLIDCRDTLKRYRERIAELEAELASRPQWAGGQSPLVCSGGSVGTKARKALEIVNDKGA